MRVDRDAPLGGIKFFRATAAGPVAGVVAGTSTIEVVVQAAHPPAIETAP